MINKTRVDRVWLVHAVTRSWLTESTRDSVRVWVILLFWLILVTCGSIFLVVLYDSWARLVVLFLGSREPPPPSHGGGGEWLIWWLFDYGWLLFRLGRDIGLIVLDWIVFGLSRGLLGSRFGHLVQAEGLWPRFGHRGWFGSYYS